MLIAEPGLHNLSFNLESLILVSLHSYVVFGPPRDQGIISGIVGFINGTL